MIDLIQHTKNSILNADNLLSKLPIEVSECPGLSSRKVRHLLNNICSFDGAKYLNLGLAGGSSFWSAIYENSIEATGVDWFCTTTTKETEKVFWKNLSNALQYERIVIDRKIEIYSQNCYNIHYKNKYNVFFYDVDHTDKAQYDSFLHFDKYLEDTCIIIIDDTNQAGVKEGSFRAFDKLNYKIKFKQELPGIFGYWDVVSDLWWNGLLIAVIEKENKSV